MNGKGTLTKKDEVYEGNFLDNKYHGKVTIILIQAIGKTQRRVRKNYSCRME